MALGDAMAGWEQAGKTFAGGGVLPASFAEAQGEQLGANTQAAIEQAKLREQEYQGRNNIGPAAAGVAGSTPALGDLAAAAARAHINPKEIIDAVTGNIENKGRVTIQDPNNPQADRVAAAQSISTAPLASPLSDANIQLANARAADATSHVPVNQSIVGLNRAHAGYYDRSPGAGMGGANMVGDFSPALKEAISSGRVDESRINSRNWRIYDQMAQSDPTLDANAAHGNAVAQSNVGLQTKIGVLNALPGNISQMVSLGTKLNYPDLKVAGEADKWLRGQNNDPDLAAYMGVRNDTLLNLASVMRGIGMSDQAHTAELEAASPTMSPSALEAWAREQLPLIQRRSAQYHNITHRDIHGGAGAPATAPATPGAAPAAPADNGGWGTATVVGGK